MIFNIKKTDWLTLGFFLIFFLIGWFYFPFTGQISYYLLGVIVVAFILGLKWSKNLESAIAIFAASLFFERFPTIEVSGFSLKISFIFGTALIFAWFINWFKNPDLRNNAFQPKIIYFSLFFFWIANLISLMVNPIEFRSIIVFLLITFCIVLFFVISTSKSSEEKLEYLSKLIIYGSLIICLFAFWQYFADLASVSTKWTILRDHYTKEIFGFPRVMGTFLEPLLFANFLILPTFLLWSLWLKEKFNNAFFVTALSIFLIIVFITISRGAYLAFAVGLLFFAILLKKDFFKIKKLLISLLVIIISCSIGWAMIRFGGGSFGAGKFVEQTSDLTKKPEDQGFSTQHRLMTFRIAKQAFSENPLFGIGPGNYGKYYSDRIEPEILKNQSQTVANEYIEILAENGIFGLIPFAIFVFSLIYFGIKKIKEQNNFRFLAVGLLSIIIALLIQYNFFSSIYVIYIWFVFALLVLQIKQTANN
jgi:O-antigen ligase